MSDPLRAAWDQLAEQQRLFAEERQQADAEWSHLFQLLEARTAAAESAEQNATAARRELEALRSEIDGLERRATHARQALAEHDSRRGDKPATSLTVVPLAVADGRSAEQVLHDLRADQAAVAHQAATLTRGRSELARYAERLADQRAVLAEQLTSLSAVGHRWRADERHTLDELEALVVACGHREAAVAARERAVAAAEEANRRRAADLWTFHTRLEEWQRALADQNAAAVDDRLEADRQLAERRLAQLDREQAWDELCRKWDERSAGLRDGLIVEVARWVDDRQACAQAVRDCDAERSKFAAEAGKLAAGWLAVQEAKAALDPAAARRLKAMEKRWTARFAAAAKELDEKAAVAAAKSAALERRYADLRKILVDATARQEAADRAERGTDPSRLPPTDDRPVALAEARTTTADATAAAARRAAEDLCARLLHADELNGVLRLEAA